jgi:deoxycytidine triphosphate deaminase
MFINPKLAIAEGWITGIADEEKQVQPNAIDFTLDRLFSIHDNTFHISEGGKKMRGGEEVYPILDRRENVEFWRLNAHSVYDGMSNIYVKVPEGVAAMLIIRSTFNRNGIFLTSGLYDSGFEGHIGFAIHNRSTSAFIAPGTRIGQIIFIPSDSAGLYAGGWNHEEGTHHSDKYPDRAGGVFHSLGGVIQDGDGPELKKQ